MSDDRKPLEQEPGDAAPRVDGASRPDLPPAPGAGAVQGGESTPVFRDIDEAVIGMYFMG